MGSAKEGAWGWGLGAWKRAEGEMERWGDNYKLGILGVRGDGIEEWGCLPQGFGLKCC